MMAIPTRQEQSDIPLVAPVKLLLTIDEAADALSVGRTLLYDLLMRKVIVSVKVGRTRRVPVKALRDYVDNLCCARGD